MATVDKVAWQISKLTRVDKPDKLIATVEKALQRIKVGGNNV